MAGATDLARMVPGFDFLQGLLKNAGAGLPNIGQWVAPTLNPEELDKRIGELRTVQFWLEQNARLLATTIQALEVQRMTLSTLQTMNLPLADLSEALKIKMPTAAAPMPAAPPEPAAAVPRKPPARRAGKASASATPATTAAIDPMQWWGALTQQFTELAAKAVKDSAADTAKSLAGAAVKQGRDTAGDVFKKAVAAPARAAARAAAPRKRGA
jgi:pyruvate/2-oxoglutarate dehydrogenase complex dihydrolipoamide acyltransferase (E2) component